MTQYQVHGGRDFIPILEGSWYGYMLQTESHHKSQFFF